MISDPNVVGLLYLVAIICFILALRFLSSPKNARRGNWIGGVGMLVAIGTTLALDGIGNWGLIAAGAAIGAVIGLVGAIVVLGFADDGVTKTIGFIAMVLATANVVGGWFVTDRMLEMFKRRPADRER